MKKTIVTVTKGYMHMDYMEAPSVGANALSQPVLVFSAVAGYSAALRVRYLPAKPLSTRSSRLRHSRLDTCSSLGEDAGARGEEVYHCRIAPPPTEGEEARRSNIRSYRFVIQIHVSRVLNSLFPLIPLMRVLPENWCHGCRPFRMRQGSLRHTCSGFPASNTCAAHGLE